MKVEEDYEWLNRCKEIKEEAKRLAWLAVPMVAVHMSQTLLQFASITMVGHLGALPLATTAIAISLCTVTGNSLTLGMASALETLCGQAYGAQQYKKLGTQTYTAIFSLVLVCIPISFLWANFAKILILMGQDPLISHEAQRYAIYLIPSLFAYATLQPLIRFFQAQSLITPMVLSSFIALSFHLPLCWVLVFKSKLGSLGSAVATGLSMWLNVIILAFYMKFSSACARTRSPLSLEVLRGVGEFFRFAIPSAGMVCLTTITTLYAIPFGIGGAASTRVSNELGAGSSNKVRIAVYCSIIVASTEAIITSSTLFAARHVFGFLFTNDARVVDYVTKMAPLVCFSLILDSLQGVLCGIARGSGWQDKATLVVLGAFYLVGIPMSIWMAFWLKMRAKGLWIGIQIGTFLQILLLALATAFTDWEKEAMMARQRLFEEECADYDTKELQDRAGGDCNGILVSGQNGYSLIENQKIQLHKENSTIF